MPQRRGEAASVQRTSGSRRIPDDQRATDDQSASNGLNEISDAPRRRDVPSGITDDLRQQFVEEMGLLWESSGMSRMQGRVLGYLMLSNEPYSSSAELAGALRASTGSISTATRLLVEAGFIRRVAVPGVRGHFFRADDDIWGAFLEGERRYLHRYRQFAEEILTALPEQEEAPRRRLSDMRDYMTWMENHHRQTIQEWEEYKRRRDKC